MELTPASSPGMRIAHSSNYVKTIVNILAQDRNILRLTAIFLKKFQSADQTGFEEDLENLTLNRSRPDVNGIVTPPAHVLTLIQALQNLYHQRDISQIGYQRGAIVELLTLKLVHHRYDQPSDVCLNNQRFSENYRDITVQEVDVAALSVMRRKAEGYECKVSASGFESYDCTNLTNLVDAANDREYRINAGFVSFENDSVMRLKLIRRFQLPAFIKQYGLDSIENLQHLPALDD